MALLELRDVGKIYRSRRRVNTYNLAAVRNVSFTVEAGTCLGLVGESGCGKSTLGRLITGLEKPSSGEIRVDGQPVHGSRWGNSALRQRVQMVFQDSLDAVNMRHSAKTIIAEPLVNFFNLSGQAEITRRVDELLGLVGLSEADKEKFPHQFSGGQLQRVCIARALASNPEILILDEPLSSLDVSVQAQILNLLHDLKQKLRLTYILISHDPEAVYYLSDAVIVMYGGSVMERIDNIGYFDRMRHPYTRRLLSSTSLYRSKKDDMRELAATDAIFIDMEAQKEGAAGCPYAGRCGKAKETCVTVRPSLIKIGEGHFAACRSLESAEVSAQ
jgi:oligopeptide/dipeptide ABC transporter ATP-binding protein